jgi:hypothetical protein
MLRVHKQAFAGKLMEEWEEKNDITRIASKNNREDS